MNLSFYNIIIVLMLSGVPVFAGGMFGGNDTTKVPAEMSATGQSRTVYSAYQDTAFFNAMRLKLPTVLRAKLDLDYSEALWNLRIKNATESTWDYIRRSLSNLPPEAYQYDPVEYVMAQTNLINSLSVPGIYQYRPQPGLVSLGAIASFLGLTEDVSSKIQYQLSITADVEVVVYSIQAVVVANMYKGVQTPGSYTLNWNGRDDKGRKMSSGDYIIEVRIGKDRYIRKRVVIE